MRRSPVPQMLLAAGLALSLTGCGSNGTDNDSALASLDTRLTDSANDAAPAPSPGTSARAGTSKQDDAVLDAHRAIMSGDTPRSDKLRSDTLRSGKESATRAGGAVAALAAANGRAVGGCAGGNLRYGERWVSAMPQGLGLYPGGRLVDAAGTDTGRCALRVISFTTADSPQAVARHYETQVRKAGFDAERQPCRTEIRLGGTRKGDDAAYMLYARRIAGNLTEVDIIASAGPAV